MKTAREQLATSLREAIRQADGFLSDHAEELIEALVESVWNDPRSGADEAEEVKHGG